MARILVQPEHLRDLAVQCRRQADDLRLELSRLGAALGSLDWQIREMAQVENTWHSARGRGYSLAEQAEALAHYLDRKAQAFADADNAGAAQFGQLALWAIPIYRNCWRPPAHIFTFPRSWVEWLLWLGRIVIMTPIPWIMTGLGSVTSIVGGLLIGRQDLRVTQSQPGVSPPTGDTDVPVTTNLPESTTVGPPPPPPLQEADPGRYSSCVLYAQARRPDLGLAAGDGGAYNYIQQYRESLRYYRVPPEAAQEGRLQQTYLRPGTVVVWDRGQQGADATYGHVAIIETVGPDYIEVSEAGWGSSTRRRLAATDLPELHFIL